jgi:hypothetical protein
MHERQLHWCLLSSMSGIHTDRSSVSVTIHLSYLSEPITEPLTKQVLYICSIQMLWCFEIIKTNLQVTACSLLDGKF